MHKSIMVLLGLLAFLIPVGSSMSNINVMAFEGYGYEADQYEQYAMDMANDNNYRSQDIDFIKKLKCNNINNNLNGDENTINWGSPLGTGAETIQEDASANAYGYGKRNNGNFDLDCINNNNNEGEQGGGATGPQGPIGPQGPPGQSIDSSRFYSVVTEFNGLISVARCDEGDVVTGGGYHATPGADVYYNRQNSPNEPSLEGWSAIIFGSGEVRATAICFDNPPLRTSLATAAVSAFQQQTEDSPIISQEIGDSPTISQEIGNSPELTALENQQPVDSPELTALEKVTKLKQQWLDLLP